MRTYKHCFFLLLDGARPDVLGHLLNEGKLPNFYKHFVENGTFTRGTTVFPSTTGAAYLPYLTGRYPGECNVPGIRWFDRKLYAKKHRFHPRRFRSYVGIESYLFNRDISSDVKTIFQLAKKPMNLFNTVSHGAGVWGDRTRFRRSAYALYGHYTQKWHRIDRLVGAETHRLVRKKPDFLFAAFPAVDEVSHQSHPNAAGVIQAYLQFDQILGRLVSECQRQKMLEDTVFIVASDHGLSATHTHFDLVGFLEGAGYATLFYPKIFKKKFDIAIMQSGNAMAHLYVKHELGWENKTYQKDLGKLIDLLSKRVEVAWVACLDEDQRVYVRSNGAEAWIREEGGNIHYKHKGGDPFQFSGIKPVMTDKESHELTFNQTYPDAFRQLLQLFSSDRTGDLIVNAKPGYDLRLKYEWPEHFSSHGSLHKDHMHVPIAISDFIGMNNIRSVDVFPLMLSMLGLK